MSVAATTSSPSIASPARASAAGAFFLTALPLALSGLALGIWTVSLRQVDLSRMNGLGLISVLPWQTLAGLALFTAAFIWSVYQSRIVVPLVFGQLIVWIFMLHGMAALVSPEPVFSVAWRHVGIAEYIMRNRSLDPTIDAYFSWPGFFGWSAVAASVAGLPSTVGFIRWAPFFFNLLYLAPLVMIFQTATRDKQTLWLGLWIFYTANWIGQDYFSPQAMAYFAYLLVFAILLRWFLSKGRSRLASDASSPQSGLWGKLRRRPDSSALRARDEMTFGGPEDLTAALAPESTSTRVLAAGALIAVFAGTVSSHQLTPFAILGGTAALVVLRQCRLRSLPVLLGVILGAWLSYMTVIFLSGHLEMAFGPTGLGETASANVGGRLQGTREHLMVVYVRMATAVLIWLLAGLGAFRARKSFRRVLPYGILAAAPFPLLVLQAYGGEMLLRIYLLTLPFCALFVGGLLTVKSKTAGRRALGGTGAAVLGMVLVFGFVVSRYGNHVIDLITPGEVEAVAELYRVAPPGSVLLAGDGNLPWKYKHYEGYDYKVLSDYNIVFDAGDKTAKILASAMRGEGKESFLIITRGQKETVKQLGTPPPPAVPSVKAQARPGWLLEVEQAVRSSEEFEILYENQDAAIFVPSEDV